MAEPSSKIIAYCHIGKVGGKRLQFYLRSYFGLSYRCVASANSVCYSREELESDLRWNPFIKYLGGHSVRPHVDYGPIGDRLAWFSVFRNPLTRILSHYYQQTTSRDFKANGLVDWLTRYPNRAHWQIYMIAGENDLSKAKDIVRKKLALVGLNEHYEQSLFLFKEALGLSNFRFVDGSSWPQPEKPARFKEILQDFETHRDEIVELLAQEIEFYDFVAERYNQQCDNYGRDNLSRDLNRHLETTRPPHKNNLNNLLATAQDRFFWRPKNSLLRIAKSG